MDKVTARVLVIVTVLLFVCGDLHGASAAETPNAAATRPDAPARSAIISQIRSKALPIGGDNPSLGLKDLAPLQTLVGDAQIVSLGEGSHGTAEFFNMKDRMLRFFAEKMGFSVFAMEASWTDALAIDDYLKTGHGSARDALAGLHYWTWDTQEVLSMIQWMRDYNAAPGPHTMLSFVGFDMPQDPIDATALVTDYVKSHDPADLVIVQRSYACLTNPSDEGSQASAAGAACRASVAKVAPLLDAKRVGVEPGPPTAAYFVARNAAEVVELAEAVNTRSLDRDAAMAKNIEWMLSNRYPGQKAALWAHNGHVANSAELGYRSMGSYLRESFGSKMFIFGMTFDSGDVRALPFQNGHVGESPIPLTVIPAGPDRSTLSCGRQGCRTLSCPCIMFHLNRRSDNGLRNRGESR